MWIDGMVPKQNPSGEEGEILSKTVGHADSLCLFCSKSYVRTSPAQRQNLSLTRTRSVVSWRGDRVRACAHANLFFFISFLYFFLHLLVLTPSQKRFIAYDPDSLYVRTYIFLAPFISPAQQYSSSSTINFLISLALWPNSQVLNQL